MSDFDQQPIIPDLPQTLSRLGRKYSGQAPDPINVLYPALSAASPAARSALQRIDLQRVARGQDPLTATQSALGVTAATQNRAITPNPEPTSFFGAALSNLTDLVRGIPQLPVALVNEARALPELTTLLPAALENSDGGGPLNTLGNVANLPGLRFVPGSFIAGAFGDTYTDPVSGAQITPEGTDTLTQNPLFTALDVLPFVSKAAKLSTPYRTAAQAIEDQARVLNNPVPRAPRPIPTALRQLGGGVEQVADLRQALIDAPGSRLPERGFGNVSLDNYVRTNPIPGPILRPGPLGRTLESGAAWFAGTAPGRLLEDARGPLARSTAERAMYRTSFLEDPDRAARLDPLAAQIMFDTTRELNELSDRAGIDQPRAQALYEDMVMGRAQDPVHAATYTPDEQAYLSRLRKGQDDIQAHLTSIGQTMYDRGRGPGVATGAKARKNVKGLLEVAFPHGKEVFDYSTGAAILDGRRAIDQSTWFRDKAAQFRSGVPVGSLTDLQAEVLGILDDPFLRGPERTQAVRLSLAHAVRSGWDVTDLLDQWDRGANKGPIKRAAFRNAIADPQFLGRQQWNRPLSATTITQAAQDLAGYRTDPKAVLLQSHLTAGRWSDALAEIRALKARRTFAPAIDLDELQVAVRDAKFEAGLTSRIEKLGATDKKIAAAQTKQATAEMKAMPARWDDVVRGEAQNSLAQFLTDLQSQGRLTAEQTQRGIEAGRDGLKAEIEAILGHDRLLMESVNSLYDEAKVTWQQLAVQGLDPRWVHRVSPSEVSRIFNPQVFDNPNLTAGQLKQRMWDPKPVHKDLTISLQHQAFDILNAKASRALADDMAEWHGVTGMELWEKYRKRIPDDVFHHPNFDARAHINKMVERDWVAYDPRKEVRGKRPQGAALQVSNSSQQVFIPRTVASTLERIRPQKLSSFQKAASRPMQVFRTSLLPLSPRWHLYNIVGGAIMLGSTFDPRAVQHFAEAYRMARNGGEELGKIESATGKVAMPPAGALREMSEWHQKMKPDARTQASIAHSVAGGATLGRVFNDIWESKASKATRDRGARIIEGSYDFNQFVDNFYRSMSYLSEQDSALRRGLSNTEAIDAGILAARDALQSWDRLTPVERSGMRVLMPFYSWCVDRDTEALTKRGWVDGDSLTTDDEILSMDPSTGELHWSTIKSIYHNPDYSGPMHRMVSSQMDALVTPGHKFATTDGELVPSDKLRQKHTIRTMGTAVDGPDVYSDAFVEVMGWAVTEGHWKRNRSGNVTTVEISQLNTGPHVDRIRLALKRSGARWHEYLAGVDHRIRYFGVTGQVAQDIVRLAPRRVMTHDFLMSLSPAQRLELIDTMIAADGSIAARGKGDRPTFVQKCDEASDRFEMLCAMSGIQTNRRKHAGLNVITLKSTTTAQVRKLRGFQPTNPALGPNPSPRPTVHYDGLVWCPETEYGTWVCRRGGKVYVTGNTSHLFRFVMQYPHDHPVRLAVTARIAETELSDQQTGLPSRFQTMFTPFGLDANGTGTAILPDGLNPFKDVTNWAMLGGFLLGQQEGNIAAVTSSLNPFISTPLEAAGFDTFRGSPDLYPDLAYNPATGQLSSIPNGNVALAMIGNIVPQSEVLLNYAGLNSDFNELWRRDPDAARRQLWGNLGLPSGLVRFGMNVPEETIKGEVARWEEMRATRSKALSSGNLGLLDSYPVLSAYRRHIEALSDSGQLDQYMPGENTATAGEVESGRPGLVDYLVG